MAFIYRTDTAAAVAHISKSSLTL